MTMSPAMSALGSQSGGRKTRRPAGGVIGSGMVMAGGVAC